ncbi:MULTISPECIES: adenosylcobinamide-GDP ribazoletransferase [Paenibacillus]|uniref:adenosylcobinamide-GDP ribazoletransferase n=1 Tax=Paenibacillus TaxID=44249 RepID=UPI001F18BAED|nr:MULTISPECIES: adenosylcobinamide-GDP ribazoletransferase [Paenibacillus]
MRQWLASLIVALQFLTRLPIPVRVDYNKHHVSRSLLFYPLSGAVIGAIVSLAAALLPHEAAPLSAAVLLLAWAMLTGGLHLDGLMDTADGIGSHRPREQMLEIMKDSRVGAMGVLAAIFVLLLKWASLWTLLTRLDHRPLPESAWFGILLTIPALSRWLMAAAIIRLPYLRGEQGMGALFREARPRYLCGALMLLLIPLFLWHSADWLWISLAQIAAGGLFAGYFVRKLGGLTGDTYGALNELVETAGLLAAAYLMV